MKIVSKTIMNIEAACDAVKVAALMTAGDKPALVGVLYGNAVDFAQRANPAGGAAFKGFAGAFRIDPLITDEAKGGYADATSSGTLFLPDAAGVTVREALTKLIYPHADKPEKKARGAVEFIGLIYVAKTEAGPMWGLDWFIKPRPIDPLASLIDTYTRAHAETAKPLPVDAKPAKGKAA